MTRALVTLISAIITMCVFLAASHARCRIPCLRPRQLGRSALTLRGDNCRKDIAVVIIA
jgi:hypothetical protein